MSNVLSHHADALLALLRSNSVLAEIVFDGQVPNPTPADHRYVLVWLHIESPLDVPGNALDATSAQITVRAICHCIGGDATASRALAFQVRTSLIDVVPTISGRSCGQISQESSAPPHLDETTGVSVFDQTDVYKLLTFPA